MAMQRNVVMQQHLQSVMYPMMIMTNMALVKCSAPSAAFVGCKHIS